MADYTSFNLEQYVRGLDGHLPEFPFSFAEWEEKATTLMSTSLLHYVAGGSGDQHTQTNNVEAFHHWGMTPRMLAAATERDLSIELFGMKLPTPLFMAPIGVTGIIDRDNDGERACARAAAATGVPFCASTLTQVPMEKIPGSLGETPGFFQLYTPSDKQLAESFISRAEAAGFKALVVTLDTWMPGYRPRDLVRSNFPQLRGWCLANYFSDQRFLDILGQDPDKDVRATARAFASVFGKSLGWEDLGWLRGTTKLPIVLKGICHPDDAKRAIDAGIDGIYVSNHGGRQANGGRAAIDMLPEVAEVCGDTPVLFDSGVRSGVDVVKALALGATAVGIGRPYSYGLAIGGAAGVEHVLRCLLAEAEIQMAIDGRADIASLRGDIQRI
ncbi:alpha-hydroxy-acid oxidizing protein [Palleronia caenipelagi]|uniref:Lactate 2-monooxygenase n=1 Tax=Palleronia caenipelagi TaxID=2489174 RepID=A0A547PNF7_9RHOB|nr:alpha-hydroxy-acid oxidizing protein [Palleronia caenipelagi]TRD15672.1 lactate 2-monooxygenase [Palleronia caenipelagi]